MGWNEILRTFNIPGDGMLQRWIEQYRKFGTCVDNLGKLPIWTIQAKADPEILKQPTKTCRKKN